MSTNSENFDRTLIKILTYMLSSDDDINADQDSQEVLKWINDMYLLDTKGINPFRSKSGNRPVQKLLILLRECMLNQRWGEALRLAQILIKEHRTMAQTVIRVCLEVCHQCDPGRGRLLEQLLNQLQTLWGVCAQELCLEYAFFLVCQDESPPLLQEALDTLKLFKKPLLVKVMHSDKDRQIISPLFDAYQGLLLHAQWLMTKSNLDTLMEDKDSSLMSEMEIAHEEKMLQLLSERAKASLRVVLGHTGVWDIFVTKLVQLLEYREELEEAEEALESYAASNPGNPNSHRYLYEFYDRHDVKDSALASLTVFARMVPSDSAVLHLYNTLKQNNSAVTERLYLLLDLLDHAEWQDQLTPWKYLADELLDLLESDYHEETAHLIQKCYTSHLSWWPGYHFTSYTVKRALGSKVNNPENEVLEGSEVIEMLVCKAAVACMFTTGADFVSKVTSMVTGDARLSEMLSRAAEVGKQLMVVSGD